MYTNSCFFGKHSECRDERGNYCDCTCHQGAAPSASRYETVLELANRVYERNAPLREATAATSRAEDNMGRGWAWIDELARQWSNLHDAEERRSMCRQSDMEDGYNDREFEDEADERRSLQLETLRGRPHAAQLEVILDILHENGARIMRPYEHWNEDESYMRYMECDRFGDSC